MDRHLLHKNVVAAGQYRTRFWRDGFRLSHLRRRVILRPVLVPSRSGLDFDLIQLQIDGRLSAEHGDDNADAVLFRLDLLDRTGEARQRAVRDAENHRVRLLLADGSSCYRARRTGERKRKSVRGCIVGSDICVLNLMIVKKGEQEIPGLTDEASAKPRRLGPKRASHIRKLFGLTKEDDVRKFVVRRVFEHNGHKHNKAPKIQRLVTHRALCHKRARLAEKKAAMEKAREAAAEYKQRVEQMDKEKKTARLHKKPVKA